MFWPPSSPTGGGPPPSTPTSSPCEHITHTHTTHTHTHTLLHVYYYRYAFGLEETNYRSKAEQVALEALAMNEKTPFATHVMGETEV